MPDMHLLAVNDMYAKYNIQGLVGSGQNCCLKFRIRIQHGMLARGTMDTAIWPLGSNH